MMKTKLSIMLLSVMALLFSAESLLAAPIGTAVSITAIRTLGVETYITVDSTLLCGTTVFWLEGTYPGAKQTAAAALLAFAMNKKVQLEVRTDTGCAGWGTKIMGITVLQ
jgi:hypothetical protein